MRFKFRYSKNEKCLYIKLLVCFLFILIFIYAEWWIFSSVKMISYSVLMFLLIISCTHMNLMVLVLKYVYTCIFNDKEWYWISEMRYICFRFIYILESNEFNNSKGVNLKISLLRYLRHNTVVKEWVSQEYYRNMVFPLFF